MFKKDVILKNVSDKEYFATVEYMSKSKIVKLAKSINNFKRQGIVESTDALRFGNLLDDFLTNPEQFKAKYTRKFSGDRRTKAGKEAYKEWQKENEGKIEVSEKDANLLVELATSLKANEDTKKYFEGDLYDYQVVGATELDFDGFKLDFKGKADIFKEYEDYIEVIDLKTISDLKQVRNNIIKYSYHLQQYLYSRIFRQISGKPVHFKFVFVEKAFPYDSQLVELNPEWMLVAHNYFLDVLIPKYKEAMSTTGLIYPKKLELEVPEWLL